MHTLDALARYLVQLQADGRSAHTIRQYQRHVRLLAGWLDERGHRGFVGDLDHEDLALFLASPTATACPDGRPKKATSANTLRSSLRTFFGYLHAAGYTPTNPARLIRRARCGTPPPRALSVDEEQRFLAAIRNAPPRDRMLFTLMVRSGIRLGSALALNVEDVDLDRREMLLRETKNDRPDVVFVPEALVRPLREYLGDRERGPLFPTRTGGRVSARHAQRRFRVYVEAAGIRGASPHALRHTFATRLYERTGDIALVQRALGHRSIVSTLVYARADQRAVQEVIA